MFTLTDGKQKDFNEPSISGDSTMKRNVGVVAVVVSALKSVSFVHLVYQSSR